MSTGAVSADPGRSRDVALTLSAGGAGFSALAIGGGFAVRGSNEEVGNTMIGIGVVSLIFTPSLGHLYGADRLFTKGLNVRLLGLGAGLLGVGAYRVVHDCEEDEAWCRKVNYGIGLTAAAIAMVGVVHDILTARPATDRANATRAAGVTVSPLVVPTADGSIGLGVSGAF